jgi:hypothetical protein
MRSTVVVVLATVATVGAVVPATGAAAVGPCSVVAPTKVVLDAPYEEVVFRLASDCAASDQAYASWEIVHPSQGYAGGVIFESNTVDYWDLYDFDGPARYTVRPSMAHDSNYDDLTQNTAAISVKLGSRLTATVSRSGGRLTFSAYASTYSPNANGWYRRAGAPLALMHLAPGSSTWSYVKAATTSSTGRATVSVIPGYGQYRLMIKETDKVWASYSTPVRGR